ncbi:hypothetical protein MPLDJ20_110025 [Mesorhizobium plurifarium]|uniref:Uncharacterized protein n=1 Tax=Mesorhizobium plurifarium TaxID=69974 RepID=A0A090DPQ4_MESPL|nr:hypothetical protein MPLDJ20_110025 [Mesorhizobium plurifarium]
MTQSRRDSEGPLRCIGPFGVKQPSYEAEGEHRRRAPLVLRYRQVDFALVLKECLYHPFACSW